MESNSSVAALVDIVCVRGDTFTRILKFWEDTNKTVPIDLSGIAYKMQVRNKSSSKAILSFEMAAGIAFTAPNILEISKTPTEMAPIPIGEFDYDIQREIDGVVETIISGKFIINQDYTL